ncbi:hypothetical protein RND81_08G174300 [Saponaria officinalis]|uniref:Dolichyl-diphosphooligosaccharide--protein glycosyltransferase subunit 4A n=1 Tax=Saponaria officinalis TaxID=3572 RepID=A0AAW1J9R4_SAPOF
MFITSYSNFNMTTDIRPKQLQMIDDQALGFIANSIGIGLFMLVIAYHYVMADPRYEGS